MKVYVVMYETGEGETGIEAIKKNYGDAVSVMKAAEASDRADTEANGEGWAVADYWIVHSEVS